MTRINLVPPAELMDQHLMAEFREIKMVPQALKRSLNAAAKDKLCYQDVLESIPRTFVLGTGHVKFFYDKGYYLQSRYYALVLELLARGYHFDTSAKFDKDDIFFCLPEAFYKDFVPSAEDLALIRARIAEKIALRPGWYRYYGEVK